MQLLPKPVSYPMSHGYFSILCPTVEVNIFLIRISITTTLLCAIPISGGQNGYSVPSIVAVPDLPEWLSVEGARKLHETTPYDKSLPPLAKRLLCDAHMCMYVSRDSSMFNRRL